MIGMVQMRPGAGLVGWTLKTRLHARGGQPLYGVFPGIAQFCTTSTGEGFMAMAVAAGHRDPWQPCGNIAEETYGRQKDQGAHRDRVKIKSST